MRYTRVCLRISERINSAFGSKIGGYFQGMLVTIATNFQGMQVTITIATNFQGMLVTIATNFQGM